MFELAEAASKFSFLLLAIVVIPISFVLPQLLQFWLGKIPDWSVLFCRVILYSALIDQITYGLISANQAIGNIGPYALTINTIKILTVPCLWLLLAMDISLSKAIWIYTFFELICAISRLPFLKYSGGLNVSLFVKNVFFKLSIPLAFLIITYALLHNLKPSLILFIIGAIPITLSYLILIYYISLNQKEKNIINNIISKIKIKI